MKKASVAVSAAASVGALVAIVVVVFWPGLRGHELRPTCHKCLMFGVRIWTNENHTAFYPNVDGLSAKSQALLIPYVGGVHVQEAYHYVPGLREDDPGDLVLFYTQRPTRYVWHGDYPTIFRKENWVVVAPDFDLFHGLRGRGELSDWVGTPELKARLRKTLAFMEDNDRPFWTNAVAEHEAFLVTIGE